MSLSSKRIKNYSFNASAKTVTFSDYATIELAGILFIKNQTTNQYIFKLQDTTSFGGVVATNVLTFSATNVGMNNADKLLIMYDDALADISTLATASNQTLINNNLTELRIQ
jgi:hypothetical protein